MKKPLTPEELERELDELARLERLPIKRLTSQLTQRKN